MHEIDVGAGEDCSEQALRDIDKLERIIAEPAGEAGGGQHHREGGEDAAEAALVKMRDGEGVVAVLAVEDLGNQVAGDDKEDIHPDKSTLKMRGFKVEQNDAKDGDSAEAIDIRTVGGKFAHGGAGLGCG